MLPEVVLEKIQKEIQGWHNSGMPASIYNAMREFGVNALTSLCLNLKKNTVNP